MDRIGFVFPGQGSQRVGMGADLADEHPELARLYYRPADEILGMPLTELCRNGPAEALRDTSVTQPAVFLTSLCTWHALRSRGLAPGAVAGHSLGEYTALAALAAAPARRPPCEPTPARRGAPSRGQHTITPGPPTAARASQRADP